MTTDRIIYATRVAIDAIEAIATKLPDDEEREACFRVLVSTLKRDDWEDDE